MQAYNPVEYQRWNLFVKIVEGFKLLPIFVKNYIIDVRMGSKYASDNSRVQP